MSGHADEDEGGGARRAAPARTDRGGETRGEERDVLVTREPVELYKVLKFEGLANSGGEAKGLVDEGRVSVNGAVETRRRRKLVDGDAVEVAGARLRIRRA